MSRKVPLGVFAAALSVSAPLSGVLAQNAGQYPTPLAEEPIPSVLTLPQTYPASWVMVHDFNFNAMIDGRGVLVDTADPATPVKGIVQIPQFGNMLVSRKGTEIYTAETYYSRLTRGERTDVITIWDKATLAPTAEILLPGGKRQQQVTYKNNFQFINDEKWAAVANFTPAQSVTIVDLANRKILSEIDLPGCSMIYPTGQRGFTTLCADGTMTTVQLGTDGSLASSTNVETRVDIDAQPLFAMPAMIGSTAWFVSYQGQVRGFDLTGAVARPIGEPFMVGTAEDAAPQWRPGGWQVITSDASGRLYVLMSPAGREGSHKDGGSEVWVLDPAKGERLSRIKLRATGISIEVTREASPRLIVARADSIVDVHDARTGALVHSLGNAVAFNPLTLSVVN